MKAPDWLTAVAPKTETAALIGRGNERRAEIEEERKTDIHFFSFSPLLDVALWRLGNFKGGCSKRVAFSKISNLIKLSGKHEISKLQADI